MKGLEEVPHLAASGRTSFAADRVDPQRLLSRGRLSSLRRARRSRRYSRTSRRSHSAGDRLPSGLTAGEPPPGAADADGFVVTVAMTSLTGCSGEAFSSILQSLGYACDAASRPGDHRCRSSRRPALEPVTPKTRGPSRRKPRARRSGRSAAAEAPPPREAEPAARAAAGRLGGSAGRERPPP